MSKTNPASDAKSIVVPPMGESVTEATIARWMKKAGDSVTMDEPLVELETDKVTLEVGAPASGTLLEISVAEGQTVGVGAILGLVGSGSVTTTSQAATPAPTVTAPVVTAAPAPQPAHQTSATELALSPAVKKLVEENHIDPRLIQGQGKDGRLTKGDVLSFIDKMKSQKATTPAPQLAPRETGPLEERVRMTRLRMRIAERLKQAQNTAAILTTFNEVDMSNIMALRNQMKDDFEKKHGCKLGFMSFFVKAAIVALKEIPAVNAEIDGEDIIYKNHYDIGVAVGTDQGLVVPVLRDADHLSFAGVEKGIADLGKKARDGSLTMQDMQGGTFTISNGGVYGSLMGTPILNPPQSGILGMHAIKQRAVVMPDGSIQARPMMYLALSYDHRIIDGKEGVSFLVRIKECIENPQRILLDI